MALKEVVERPQLWNELRKSFYITFADGRSFFAVCIGSGFFFPSYVSSAEIDALQNAIPADQLAPILINLEEIRKSIFTSDAWSFFVVLIGAVLL